MRKKIFMLLLRILRFLGKEAEYVPQLRSQRVVRYNRLYHHFGRIVLAVKNPDPVELHYFRKKYDEEGWTEICKQEYHHTLELQNKGMFLDVKLRFEQRGDKCAICAMHRLAIPCHCCFPDGDRTGYFKLIHQNRQFSDITTL
jgi:hypothetical protein